MNVQNLKLVLLGDPETGKTCFATAYTTNAIPAVYEPTVVGNYSCNVLLDEKPFRLSLWDTASEESYERLRAQVYPQTDAFLLCFSVENHVSLENITAKWMPIIRHYDPHTPVVLIACKTDIRGSRHCVTYDEGYDVAKKTKAAAYVETSALIQNGLKSCFEQALRAVLSIMSASKTQNKCGLPFPVFPPAEKAPLVKIEKSVFADDWYKSLQDPKFHDVTFLVDGTRHLHAHRIVLISASSFFGKVLASSLPSKSSQQHELNQFDRFSHEDINSGKVEGISSVYQVSSQSGQDTIIELSADIKAKTFVRVLEFLYTGYPGLPKDAGKGDIQDLRHVSTIFKLPYLTSCICDNFEREEEFRSPKIGTDHMDEISKRMKELFFNQEAYADVVFNVEGTAVFAHKVVLATRSDVMAAMFFGRFTEACGKTVVNIHNTTAESFLILLEYTCMYTDHAPLEESSDMIGVLSLAHEYCQTRLVNLCELYISKKIDKVCQNMTEKAQIDVINILKSAHIFNAKQLVTSCLHCISTNYAAFSKRKEFTVLNSDDRQHVEENRWTSLAYRKSIEEFENEMAKEGKKCIMM